jgi:hypothetical protein
MQTAPTFPFFIVIASIDFYNMKRSSEFEFEDCFVMYACSSSIVLVQHMCGMCGIAELRVQYRNFECGAREGSRKGRGYKDVEIFSEIVILIIKSFNCTSSSNSI